MAEGELAKPNPMIDRDMLSLIVDNAILKASVEQVRIISEVQKDGIRVATSLEALKASIDAMGSGFVGSLAALEAKVHIQNNRIAALEKLKWLVMGAMILLGIAQPFILHFWK